MGISLSLLLPQSLSGGSLATGYAQEPLDTWKGHGLNHAGSPYSFISIRSHDV
jgi:hypothetical protein